MRIIASKRFAKQMTKLPTKTREEVIAVLTEIEDADTIGNIANIEKMRGHSSAYEFG